MNNPVSRSSVVTPRILIVDDDITTLRLIERFLRNEVYDVQSVDDHERAMQLLHTRWVDVLICDLLMPTHGGVRTIRECKRQRPGTRIIVMSAKLDFEEWALRLGADFTLSKPFTRAALIELIDRCVATPPQRTPGSRGRSR